MTKNIMNLMHNPTTTCCQITSDLVRQTLACVLIPKLEAPLWCCGLQVVKSENKKKVLNAVLLISKCVSLNRVHESKTYTDIGMVSVWLNTSEAFTTTRSFAA